jgi:hypothetical protein
VESKSAVKNKTPNNQYFANFFWKLKLCKQNEVVPALREPLAKYRFHIKSFFLKFLSMPFSLPGMMADCIADLLCNNCFSPNMFFSD